MTTSTQPHATYTPGTLPVLDASETELARLREVFVRERFTFGELFQRGETEREKGREVVGDPTSPPADACEVLRVLFVAGGPVPWTVVRERVAPDDLALLEGLGLLRTHDVKHDCCLGTVLVCPIAGLWLLCDHPYAGEGRQMASDIVYSPLTTNTQQFMLLIPRTPCDELLELCSGSGVAALASARLARQVCAIDITERSTRFARANARLNGIANAEALQGDLYAPVAGRTFDRIVAHPPYMPAFEQEFVFRDGGADGEQITRRIFEGAADHLRPGGRLHVVCLATDRKDAPLEQRVRGWLGERQDEFDVLVLELQTPRDPTEFYAHRAYDQGGGFAEVEPRHRFFRELGITRLVYSAIVVQRRASARPTFTVRRKKGTLTASAQVDWAVAWETLATDASLPARVLDVTPRVSPELRMQLTYVPHTGSFALAESALVVDSPLAFLVECPAWVPQFLERALVPRTVREHLAVLQRDGVVPGDVAPEQFAAAVRDLAGTGVVQLPGCEPPPPDPTLVRVLDGWWVEQPSSLERLAAGAG